VVADWLQTGTLQKAVLVIMSTSTSEVLERWSFDIQTNKGAIVGEGCVGIGLHGVAVVCLGVQARCPGCWLVVDVSIQYGCYAWMQKH